MFFEEPVELAPSVAPLVVTDMEEALVVVIFVADA
jgi:hypothetical protein